MKRLLFMLIFALMFPVNARAEEVHRCTLTSYLPTGNDTCEGDKPHRGIMAAKKDWIGKTAAVYKREPDETLGDFIGYFEISDTGEGKNGAIRKGYVVDVFCECEQELIPTTKIYLFLFDAEG